MTCLVDGDVLMYRAGFGSKGDFIQTVELLESFLQSIYDKTNATDSKLILSGATNFRKQIDSNYKASRKETARPQYYKELREYSINELGAILSVDCEADDLLGALQTDETVICSSDKDCLQVPGYHYRFKKNWSDNELIYVDEDTSWLHFFTQCLCGDITDDIEGVKNPAKAHHKNPPNFSSDSATKLLEGLTKEQMLETVQEMYRLQYGDEWFSFFDKNCRLLFIQRNNAKEYFELL